MLFFKKICYGILFCFFLFQVAFAQNPHGSIPSPPVINTFELPSIPDVLYDSQKDEGFVFAYPFDIVINVLEFASKYQTENENVYIMRITSQNAYSLNVIFNKFSVPEGAKLFLFNSDSTSFAGPYTDKNNYESLVLPTPIIAGNTIIIQYSEPINISYNTQLQISRISHDYKNILKQSSNIEDGAGACNVDINCADGNNWQKDKHSICRIIINGTTTCSATLLNNTLNDGKPYVLTANHCLASNQKALATVFYFDYEYPSCNQSGTISNKNSISGSQLRATGPNNKIDFTLLEMNEIPPESYKVYYAGWDASGDANSEVTILHHPRGDAMKISIDSNNVSTASFHTYSLFTHWKVSDWEIGTTESGSSGGGLFNKSHKLIGTLSGGEATCENRVNDYFSKFSSAYDNSNNPASQLKHWLDPLNYGVSICPGFDPLFIASDIISNVLPSDSIVTTNFGSHAKGSMGGTTEVGWNSAADLFLYSSNKIIFALTFAVDVLPNADLSNVDIIVWDGVSSPSTVIFQQTLADSNLVDSNYIYLYFTTPIATTGHFWVGYSIKNNENKISFKLAKQRTERLNTFWIKHNVFDWLSADSINANTCFGLDVKVTNEPDTLPSYIPFVVPHFISKISNFDYEFYSNELFGIDSLGDISNQTEFLNVSSKNNISDWGGPSELHANCIANKYEINQKTLIRGLKLGIKEIPISKEITYFLWNDFDSIIVNDSITSDLCAIGLFNQLHFSNPIRVDSSFYAGVCFDSIDYQNNISLYQYKSSNMEEAYFSVSDFWTPYDVFSIDYAFAMQPISCYSKYHFNKDSAIVLKTPIFIKNDLLLENSNDFLVYPTHCSQTFTVESKWVYFGTLTVELYNTLGVIVSKQIVKNIQGKYSVDVSFLPAGVYVVRIISDIGSDEQKVFIYH